MTLLAGTIMAIGFWCFLHNQVAALSFATSLSLLLFLFRTSPQVGITAAMLFLALLGDIRRVISAVVGFAAFDPMVLVGAAFVVLIVGPMLVRIKLKDTPSKLVFFLMLIQLAQIFNPGQGGVSVGMAGFLLVGTPILWFWVGRRWGSEQLLQNLMYKVVIGLGILASLFGYYQTALGVLPWQKPWIQHLVDLYGSVGALSIGGAGVRSFGFSTISSEYINLLVFAVFFCISGIITGARSLWICLGELEPGHLLASSRGAILRVLIFLSICWALKGRTGTARTSRLVLALVITFGGLSVLLSRVGDYKVSSSHATETDYALAHNVNGLAHPLETKSSTLGLHAAEIGEGFLLGLRRPIGYGIGSTTSAASKFGTAGVGTEFDLSDAFIGLGIPGGLLLLAVTWQVTVVSLRYSRSGPDALALPIAAMLLPLLGNWIFQGEYFTGPLFWILIGSVVGIQVRQEDEAKELRTAKAGQSRWQSGTNSSAANLGALNV